MVFKRECPVQPVRIGRYVRWDRTTLDLWLDGLSKTDFDMTSDDWSRVMDEAEEKLPAKRSRRSAQT